MTGRVFQINVSQGGVPKRAVAGATLHELGFEGDKVANPRVHGGPMRAVCIYALERILAHQEAGKPIFPGAIGENVTTVGIEWDTVVPGARMELGPALVEVTRYATPCGTTAPFLSGDLACYHQDLNPGWSRVYARVLRGGPVRAGDPARVVA